MVRLGFEMLDIEVWEYGKSVLFGIELGFYILFVVVFVWLSVWMDD